MWDERPRGRKLLVADIASRIDVEVDSRTVINESYVIEYPNDYTMREILCHIAAAHAGNWIITADGKLLLVPAFYCNASRDILFNRRQRKCHSVWRG